MPRPVRDGLSTSISAQRFNEVGLLKPWNGRDYEGGGGSDRMT
jgi:hypothetical protein